MQNDSHVPILCPVDFSDISAQALRYAVELARCHDSPVTALHASWWDVPAYFTEARVAELQKEFRDSQRAAGRHLREFVDATLGPAGKMVSTRLAEALPADGILRAALETGAGLIVMGTHGRSGWNRWTLGSVAERVLRESSVPVLTVRQPLQRPIQNILCPVSDTQESRRALEVASRVGACFDALVTALHVHEPQANAAIPDLCAWIPPEQRSACNIRELVQHGDAAEEIIRVASAGNYDLLVIGSPRRHFFDGMVLGNTTLRAVRHAPCPVLTVPPLS